jgi:argininosuccinate lyase
MPHKKNPDVFELIRGKCNKIKAISNEINLLTTNLPMGYHRDMQLLKENLFDGIASLKDCLYMTEFMLGQIKVKDNIIEADKYKYLFTVEKVNELVLRGLSFRDAYLKVAEMIENGTYKPDYNIKHSHEGSIGNLCNDKIIDKMNLLTDYFSNKFSNIKISMDQLIAGESV